MRVLFWNTHNNPRINPILSELIVENHIDLVILAEYQADKSELISLLHCRGIRMRFLYSIGCERISMLSSIENVVQSTQHKFYSVQIISHYFIVCGAHLQSKIYCSGDQQREYLIKKLVDDICEVEIANQMENTIIVGDFNINPYEIGCVKSDLLNSIPYYELANKKAKNIYGKEYKLFYNPMWRFLNDYNNSVGTYYYDANSPENIYWNVFDQVIFRPCLFDKFNNESLKILLSTSSYSLLNRNGIPDVKKVSDHLPIMFEFKEE